MIQGLFDLITAFFAPPPPPVKKGLLAKIFELPSTRKRRKLIDKINSTNFKQWKLRLCLELILFLFSSIFLLCVLQKYATLTGIHWVIFVRIPIYLGGLWAISQITTRNPKPEVLEFVATNDALGYGFGGAGLVGGIATGAALGAHVGIALGPLGAIAGTIPGAVIGGVIGLLGGVQAADHTVMVLNREQRALPPPMQCAAGIAGGLGGVIAGAWYGAGTGLVLGPFGAIAGTIPGAVIGGIVCGLSGMRAANYLPEG